MTTPPHKVVHLITRLELGGAQGNTIYTTQHLNSNKFETYLWTGRGGYWDKELEISRERQYRLSFFSHLVRSLHPLYDLLALWDIYWALRKRKPQILHTHSSKAGILGRWAGFLARVPIIIHTFHGFGFNSHQKPWTRAFFILLEKWMAHFSIRLIFVSKANMEVAKKYGIGDPDKYFLIRSGVPINQIKTQQMGVDKVSLRRKLGIPISSPLITTIGAFKPQKNLEDFVRMASRIHEKRKDAYFLMVGDGFLRPYLEEKIRERNLIDQIRLLGWQKEVIPWLSISHVFVLTSLWEGLPRALVEALILGIPSVCYDTDGVHDLLTQGGGVLIKPLDVESLSSAVLELMTNLKQHEAFSRKAKRLIGSEFDIDFMVKQQADLYELLINPNPTNL